MSIPKPHSTTIILLAMVVIATGIPATLSSREYDGRFKCRGRIGDCIGLDNEAATESEISRRGLQQARYISYDALKQNNVPCNQRGISYYNCQPGAPANPYQRGCTVITHCYRFTA